MILMLALSGGRSVCVEAKRVVVVLRLLIRMLRKLGLDDLRLMGIVQEGIS